MGMHFRGKGLGTNAMCNAAAALQGVERGCRRTWMRMLLCCMCAGRHVAVRWVAKQTYCAGPRRRGRPLECHERA